MAKRKRKRDRNAAATQPSQPPVRPASSSPRRPVPPDIARPPYARPATRDLGRCRIVRTPDEIERMRRAGAVAAEILLRSAATSARASPPTRSTRSSTTRPSAAAATPARSTTAGFPKSVCTSVNEVICHGIPDTRRSRRRRHRQHRRHGLLRRRPRRHLGHVLRRRRRRRLSAPGPRDPRRHERGHRRGAARRPVNDIGRAIETHAHAARPRRSCASSSATAIGTEFHSALADPALLRPAAPPPSSSRGMTFTIEPMLTLGGPTSTSGTTTGPRSPPTVAAPPSSSTPWWSPPTGSRS